MKRKSIIETAGGGPTVFYQVDRLRQHLGGVEERGVRTGVVFGPASSSTFEVLVGPRLRLGKNEVLRVTKVEGVV